MAVPTNLDEALALLTAPSSEDPITGQDVRDVVTWLAGGVSVEERTFSTRVDLAGGSYRQVMPSGAGILGLGSKPYVPGTFCDTFVPASVTSLALPPGLPSVGWVQGTTCVIRLEATSTTTATATRAVVASPSTSAPTFTIGTDTSALSQLSLVPSIASQFVDGSLSGAALGGVMDVARTLTGIVSGNGTTEIVLSLSGPLDPADEPAFTLSTGHSLRSMAGVLASNGSTPVTIIALSAPELLAAYVPTEDRDRLWLDFDSAVVVDLLAGVTINVISGTTRVVATLVSGDGTSSLVFGLSGDLDTTTVMTVTIDAGAIRRVSDSAPNEATTINHTWYTAPNELTGFTQGRIASNAMSGGNWPTGFGDAIVWGTLSGVVDTVANGYEGFNIQRFQKSAPDYLYISSPGTNQLGAITSTTAWNSWTFFVPQSLGTDNVAAAYYNNEGVIGAQGSWGVALRNGNSIGADSARAQVNSFDGTYVALEVPIELHQPACIRGRLASNVMYARRDLAPSEASAAHTGPTVVASSVLIGCTSTTAGRQADVDVLAFITTNQDQPAHKALGIYGWAERQVWGGFLRPQPLFPKKVYAVAGQAVSLAWESCILIGYPAAITVTTVGVGTDSADGWSWTPTGGDVGDHVVEVTISSAADSRILRRAKFEVHVEAATGTGAISVLHVGDSNIASATVCTQTRTALNAQGLTCTNIGSLGTPPNKHDGVGGYSWDETLIGQSGVGSAFAGGIVNATEYDIAGYVAANGLPDVIVCHFATNDIGTYYGSVGENPAAYVGTRIPEIIAAAEAFITAWHTYDPTIPVVVVNPLPINRRQSAFTSNYGTGIIRWGMRRMLHRLRAAYDAAFGNRENENVYQLASEMVDGLNDFDGTNAVHPIAAGSQKEGDQIAAFCRSL